MSTLSVQTVIIFLLITFAYCDNITSYDRSARTVKYCIAINNRTQNTEDLVGTWYTIYKYVYGITPNGGDYCATTTLTKPTREELDAYKTKYNLTNETFTFNDGAVLSSQLQGKLKGLFVGNKTAKYYFLDTKSSMRLMGMYEVVTFKPINNDYLIFYQCNMRGHVKYLWSRKRDQTEDELEKALQGVYELAGLSKQRYCTPKRVVSSTTEYFK